MERRTLRRWQLAAVSLLILGLWLFTDRDPATQPPAPVPGPAPAPVPSAQLLPALDPDELLEPDAHTLTCRKALPRRPPGTYACIQSERAHVCVDPLLDWGHEEMKAFSDLAQEKLEEAAFVIDHPPASTMVILHHADTWDELLGERNPELLGIFDGAVQLYMTNGYIQTLRHELMHAQIHASASCTPLSLNEGIAAWFGGRENVFMIYALQDRPTHSIDELERMLHSEPWHKKVRAYAEAHLRVLVAVEQRGEPAIGDALRAIADGEDTPEDAWTALDPMSHDPDYLAATMPQMAGKVLVGRDMTLTEARTRLATYIRCRERPFDDPSAWGNYGIDALTRLCKSEDDAP